MDGTATVTIAMAVVYEVQSLLVVVLLELVQDIQSLLDLVIESLWGIEKVEQFGIVHLEQHAGDLASKLGLGSVVEKSASWIERKM